MAALNTTTFGYALKTVYTKKAVLDLAYKAGRSPFFAMVKKDENFVGANYVEAVSYGDIAGGSADFNTAQALKNPALGKAFTITRVKDYALASIDSETILASKGSEGALLEAVKREVDSAVNVVGRSIAKGCYGDGTMTLGSISSLSSGVVTLTNASDVTNFEVGMELAAAANTSSAIRAGYGTVTAVDRDAGTVTVESGADPSGWAAADELFRKGDYASASDANGIKGLQAWLPATAPGSTSFFGVDRSADTTRLGGCRVSGSGLRLDEALFKGCVRAAREGGSPEWCFINFENYEELINILGSKLEYQTTEVTAGIGFEGCKIHSPTGVVKIFPDINCPATNAYLIDPEIPVLRSLGPAPRILDLDGMKMQRESTADAYEVRVAFFGNLSLGRGPGKCCVVSSI